MYTDSELRKQILELDQEAMAYFYSRFRDKVLGLARKWLKSEDYAQDFIHDFFERFMFGRKGHASVMEAFNPDRSTLETFLNKELSYRLLDAVRRKQRQDKAGAIPLDDGDENASVQAEAMIANETPDKAAEINELLSVLRSNIGKLGRNCQEVFRYKYFLEYSYEEIGDKIGKPRGTVSSRLRDCMDKLRQLMGSKYRAGDFL